MADQVPTDTTAARPVPGLVASFFTLSGAGFVQPPRNTFIERCEAAAAAGFTGIGLHSDDLPRTVAAGVDVAEMRAVLRHNSLDLVEIEFLGDWAFSSPGGDGLSPSLDGIEDVAAALGGRQVSADRSAPANSADRPSWTPTGHWTTRPGRSRPTPTGWPSAAAGRTGIVSLVGADEHAAREVLLRAGAPNAGLLIDIWHYYNGGGTPAEPGGPARHHRCPTQRRADGPRGLLDANTPRRPPC